MSRTTRQARWSAAQRRNHVAAIALHQVGDPYRYGGGGPRAFDCSGLAQWSFRHYRRLPHNAAAQSRRGRPIARRWVAPGDLAYWGGRGTAYHVGVVVYVGRRGVRVVDAPYGGQRVAVRRPWPGARYARLVG